MREGEGKITDNNSKINCSVACLNLIDHRFLMDELEFINTSGFEFMVYSIWTEQYPEIARRLKSASYRFDSIHGPKQTGRLLSENDPESHKQALELIKKSIDTAFELGASVLTTHLWDQNSIDPRLTGNLESLYKLKNYALEKGISISVEFIPHTKGWGYLKTAEYLYNKLDPAFSFTLDLEFAAWNDDIVEIAKFADRISNVHIRDYNGSPVDSNGRRYYCLPGLGKTDFALAFKELRNNGYKGLYTLEARHYSTRDVNDSLALLNEEMNKD